MRIIYGKVDYTSSFRKFSNDLDSSLSFIGSLGIGLLSMQANSLINHEDHFNLMASDIMMRYSSEITANQISIETGSIHQEGEALLDVTARGGSATEGDGGVLAGDGAGVGAGHGGYGGGADLDNFTSGSFFFS